MRTHSQISRIIKINKTDLGENVKSHMNIKAIESVAKKVFP